MSMSKRKMSMAPSEGRRKQSVDGKKSLDPPVSEGRRESISQLRRGSISMRRMSISDRKFSMADSLAGRSGMMSAGKDGRMNIKYENTYKMEPDNQFPIFKAKKIAVEMLESNLEGQKYSPDDCSRAARELSDKIKQRIKAQCAYPRFKIVVIVAIGQTQETLPSLSFTSRCIWNDKLDNFAEATFKTRNLYAVALVYAMYAD